MVDLKTRIREMKGDEGNHYEKQELKRISHASQFTIPNSAGMSPDPVCNYTDTRSSHRNQARRTPDFSYPLVSSTSFSSWSPISLFLFTTLTSLQNTKLSYPSLSLHVMIMSWHWVHHPPSTAYTEYSVHRVPNIVCLPFFLIITSWPLNIAWASGVPPYTIDCHQPALHESSKVKLPCHIPTVAS